MVSEREMPNDWIGQCFGCSRTNEQGLKLRFWLSEHGCFTRCIIPDYLCGLEGVVHGGITTLLLDEIAQWVLIACLGKMGVTHELSVRFFKPVLTNVELRVEGQIIKQEGKSAVIHSAMYSPDNVLLAEGEISYILPSLSTIAKITAVDELKLREFLSKYPIRENNCSK